MTEQRVVRPASEEILTSPVREDIRTSDLTPRLAEDGEHIREYSPVLHDKPVREVPAVARDGKRFGTNVLPESLCVSPDNARSILALSYGFDTADSMVGRAMATGTVVNGEKFTVTDSQAKTKGHWAVTTDKSRPGMLVIIAAILKQSGGRRK